MGRKTRHFITKHVTLPFHYNERELSFIVISIVGKLGRYEPKTRIGQNATYQQNIVIGENVEYVKVIYRCVNIKLSDISSKNWINVFKSMLSCRPQILFFKFKGHWGHLRKVLKGTKANTWLIKHTTTFIEIWGHQGKTSKGAGNGLRGLHEIWGLLSCIKNIGPYGSDRKVEPWEKIATKLQQNCRNGIPCMTD